MTHYCHQVSGVFTRRSQADCAKQDLLGLGIRLDRVRIFDNQELVPSGRLRATTDFSSVTRLRQISPFGSRCSDGIVQSA